PSNGETRRVAMRDLKVPENGDLAMLFESDRIFWIDADRISWRLYFPSQTTDFVPFSSSGPDNLRGLSTSQIQAKYALASGGQGAPRGASKWQVRNGVAWRVEQRPLFRPRLKWRSRRARRASSILLRANTSSMSQSRPREADGGSRVAK